MSWIRRTLDNFLRKFGWAVRVERRVRDGEAAYWVKYRRVTGGVWHLDPEQPGPFDSKEMAEAQAKRRAKRLARAEHKWTDAVVWEIGQVRW